MIYCFDFCVIFKGRYSGSWTIYGCAFLLLTHMLVKALGLYYGGRHALSILLLAYHHVLFSHKFLLL